MRRAFGRWWRRQPWWFKAALFALLPLLWLNLSVAWVGSSAVFPLSPFFLKEKWLALKTYAVHRPGCLVDGHEEMDRHIAAATRKHRLPPGLLGALIEIESGTRPHRISPAGAMGPAQLMPGTASDLGVKDPFDEAQAIDASARYLASHLRRFRDLRLAVAAYNAGPGNVSDRRIPRNGETEFYVRKVMAEYERRRPRPQPETKSKRSARGSGKHTR
ncbi:MAG: lytic transglycosylase domain-containing protein [Myxococcaceae bacterium]